MGWLCLYALGLVAFAAVGHFLWWIGANILRGLFGNAAVSSQPVRRARPFTNCPACRAEVAAQDEECSFCGLLLDSRMARQLSRVRAAEAEVRALAEAGDLDAETAKSVTEQLERRARVIQGLPAEGPVRTPIPRLPVFRRPAPATPPTPAPAVEPLPVPAPAAPEAAAPVVPTEPPAPPEPPRRRGTVLAAFMEERNILWGELVGGLLIVGCSIALVVTLWHRLEAIPYFPFLLSAAVTLALFGAGQYTLHHWKLTATSRGLLVIALLLAPLNLLLLADPITRGSLHSGRCRGETRRGLAAGVDRAHWRA